MSTKHLILTLLKMQPDTGYGLAYRNIASMGPLWSATHSQVYSALRKLLENGLVSADTDLAPSARERTVYRLTAAGMRELEEWRCAPVKYLPRRDPFRFLMAYMDELPAEAVYAAIDQHIRHHRDLARQLEQQAGELREGCNKAFEERHAALPERDRVRLRRTRAAIYEDIAKLAECEIQSAERIRLVAAEIHPRDS